MPEDKKSKLEDNVENEKLVIDDDVDDNDDNDGNDGNDSNDGNDGNDGNDDNDDNDDDDDDNEDDDDESVDADVLTDVGLYNVLANFFSYTDEKNEQVSIAESFGTIALELKRLNGYVKRLVPEKSSK